MHGDCSGCAGADPGFQVRGGGGGALKKITRAEKVRNVWGISCENFFSNCGGRRPPPGSAPVVCVCVCVCAMRLTQE